MSHRIRLRGFWTATSLEDGRTRWVRKFGQPRSLDPAESAWLTADRLPSSATVYLNGQLIGTVTESGFTIEVTGKLLPRNEVCLELSGEVEELFLDIHSLT
jgi:hypothetical protein